MNVNPLQPGIIALQSNQTESLAQALVAWLQRNPLGPLEEEIILVQSNAMAEWVKMVLAEQGGVCAATRVELPARFMWRTYRQVLGPHAVAKHSPLDKSPLTWRLMALLPELLHEPAFAPVASFLRPDSRSRLYPLASRLADLLDQYQVYRSDWLDLWANGQDVLSHPSRAAVALPPDQLWQAQLWRALMAQLNEHERGSGRPMLHQKVVAHLQGEQATAQPVARRVVAFGMTQLPQSVLQLLAALAGRSQVMLAIPNPCRFHWGDIMDGRELHQQIRRQSPLRKGHDLAALPLSELHLHAHPLLAAWGRQGRDFVRQTDAFDEQQQALGLPPVVRVDLFEESPPEGATLLQQVQAHIRDLLPLAEHPAVSVPQADHSMVFHIAHSLVRELEVLQDHLLALLATPGQGDGLPPLQARQVVVMLPAIELAAPAIRAVFGQYRAGDARHIPFDIADLSTKAVSPLVLALEWVLRLPSERCSQSELRDFLSQPSVAARFGLALEDLPRLMQWLSGAGVRWGLDAAHRDTLGLALCGEPNTSLFGLRRMLMGFATGTNTHLQSHTFAGIEPYGEVGGLDAELAGAFAHLLDTLMDWQAQSQAPRTPLAWAVLFRSLLAGLFKAHNTEDQGHLAALEQGLQSWLNACELAQFDQAVALDVARSAWLDALDDAGLEKRFRAGGVTFCTMMPMRAIPFDVVCLVGMNEQDYPRRAHRSDFDLMGLPGQFRPGDRARRDDDRQLMLEALLSARRQLVISWSGRSVRDNTEQPPSVLVTQLRDYLQAGWGPEVVAQRTTEHPMQAFSRQYFEQGSGLFTYAREWRAAHESPASTEAHTPPLANGSEPDTQAALSCDLLQQFLRNPVRAYFRHRLGVVFEALSQGDLDDEHFDLAGLERFDVVRQLLDECLAGLPLVATPATPLGPSDRPDPQQVLQHALHKLERAGQLPMAGMGRRTVAQLQQAMLPMLRQWQALGDEPALGGASPERQHLRFVHGSLVLEDWLAPSASGQWVRLEPMVMTEPGKPTQVRVARVLLSWLMSLLASANGTPLVTRLIGLDATVLGLPLAPELASEQLKQVLDMWQQGMSEPLPLPFKTAWTLCQRPQDAAKTYEGDYLSAGECLEPCLGRVFPDYPSLVQDGRFETLAHALMTPLSDWVTQCVSVIPHSGTSAQPDESRQETA